MDVYWTDMKIIYFRIKIFFSKFRENPTVVQTSTAAL
jgi:hypothetical protein